MIVYTYACMYHYTNLTYIGRCYFWNTVGFGSIVAQYVLVSQCHTILPYHIMPYRPTQSSSVRCLVVEPSGKVFVSGHSDGMVAFIAFHKISHCTGYITVSDIASYANTFLPDGSVLPEYAPPPQLCRWRASLTDITAVSFAPSTAAQ